MKWRRNRIDRHNQMVGELRSLIHDLSVTHNVKHTVEYGPRPKPTYIYIEIQNSRGELWKLQPIQVTGQYAVPVNLPIEWLTGRHEDMSAYPNAQLRISYE